MILDLFKKIGPNTPSLPVTHNLIVCTPGEDPVQYVLNSDRIGLGRSSDNHVQINRKCVSNGHLELQKNSDGEYEVVDLGSSNGTSINGSRITNHTLVDGDRILIGRKIAAHYMILPEEAEPEYGVDVDRDADVEALAEYETFDRRLRNICKDYSYLERKMKVKEAEFADLMDSIVEAKTQPEKVAAKAEENIVQVPVNITHRISVKESGNVTERRPEPKQKAVIPRRSKNRENSEVTLAS